MENEFVIYVRTNHDNGLQYIGQTSDLKKREKQWENKNAHYANQFIDNDRFNGKWTVDVIATTDTREKAWELERRLIKELGTLYPNGYNVDEGGEFGVEKGFNPSDFRKSIKPNSPISIDEDSEKIGDTIVKKHVIQYRKDGILLKEWDNIKKASEGTNICQHSIRQCCKGKLLTAGGYKWEFKYI